MKKVVGRLTALVVVVAGTFVAAPAQSQAGQQLTGSVTIQGDSLTALDYAVFLKHADTGSGAGQGFHTSAFSMGVSTFPAGEWVVMVRLAMMDNTERYYVAGDPDGSLDRADATVVTLGNGDPLPTVDLVLQPTASLTGHVTDPTGAGVAGATVEIDRFHPWGFPHRATTDADGFFDLGYVRAGERHVEVVGRDDLAGSGADITVPDSGALTADLAMSSPSAALEGTVVDSVTGDPLSYSSVEVWLQPWDVRSGTTRADGAGHFEFTGLRTGDYELRAEDEMSFMGAGVGLESPVAVVAGETTTHDVPVEAVTNPWDYTASGTVTDLQGQPLVGMTVTATALAGWPQADTVTDRDGNWRLQLPDGDYRVRIEPRRLWYQVRPGQALWTPEYYPDSYGVAGAATVTVADQQPVTGLDVALDLGTLVTLDLEDPSGAGVDSAGYRLFDATSGEQVEEVLTGGMFVGPLELRLPAGSWKVLLTGSGRGFGWLVPQWFGGAPSFATATTLTLAPGEVRAPISMTLPATLEPTKEPRIIGKPRPGRTLRATKGQWNLMTGNTYELTWYRGGTAVGSGQQYVVRRADRGKRLTVVVVVDHDGLRGESTVTTWIPRG